MVDWICSPRQKADANDRPGPDDEAHMPTMKPTGHGDGDVCLLRLLAESSVVGANIYMVWTMEFLPESDQS